jgi:hypothetical protein
MAGKLWERYIDSGVVDSRCAGGGCVGGKGVNLDCHFYGASLKSELKLAYAFTYIIADEDKTVELRVGSSDGQMTWINGEPVWNGAKADKCRCWTLDSNVNAGHERDTAMIKLKKGINTLMVKVGGESRDSAWGFAAAIPKNEGLLSATSTMGAAATVDASAQPPFRIDNSGRLFVVNPDWLDFEEQKAYSLQIRVRDSGGLTHSGRVKIEVNDDNEAPAYMATVRLEVPENSAGGTLVGIPVTPSDYDMDQTYTYTLTGGGSSFDIQAESGQIFVKEGAALNFEGPQNRFTVVAEATDSGDPPSKSNIVIEIRLSDVNESPSLPEDVVIEVREDAKPGSGAGVPMSVLANDPDENSKISFSKNFLDVDIRAEGCDDPGRRGGCGLSSVKIGGKDVAMHNRGHNVAVLDESSGTVLASESFDTHGNPQAGKDLHKFINDVDDGRVVVVATQDSAATYASAANDAMTSIGATPMKLKLRDSFAVVGKKGIFGPLKSGSYRRVFVDGVVENKDGKVQDVRKCLTAENGEAGVAGVVLKDCMFDDDMEYQLWSSARGMMVNAATGMCIDVDAAKSGTSTAEPQWPLRQGDPIVQRMCSEASDKLWHERKEDGKIQSTWTDNTWAAKKPLCMDVPLTVQTSSPLNDIMTGSLNPIGEWQESPEFDSAELIGNGDFAGQKGIENEHGSYSGSVVCPAGFTKCGGMEIKKLSGGSFPCLARDLDDNCIKQLSEKARDKYFLRIKPGSGNNGYGEYEVHQDDAKFKGGPLGAGLFRISVWARCNNGFNHPAKQLLHSRWWDTNGVVIGTTEGGWFEDEQMAACDGSAGDAWEQISIEFDTKGKSVGSFALYLAYPLQATEGELDITGVSVRPVIWKTDGESLRVRNTAGSSAMPSAREGFDFSGSHRGNSNRGMLVDWLILGQRGAYRDSGRGPFPQRSYCGIDRDSRYGLNDVPHRELPKRNWREGDMYGSRQWVKYRDNGKSRSACGGGNNGYGVNLECHFCHTASRGHHCDRVNAFALTYIHSDRARKMRMWLSSDDGQYIWLNGNPIRTNKANLCQRYNSLHNGAFTIDLKQGTNALMVRIGEYWGLWGFVAHLECMDSNCFNGVSSSLEPPTGGSALLYKGSAMDEYTDYEVETSILLGNKGWAGVQARATDDKNFIAFETSHEHSAHRLYRVVDGQQRTMASVSSKIADAAKDVHVELVVRGDRAMASVNGKVVLTATDALMSSNGVLSKGSVALSSAGALGAVFKEFRVGVDTPGLINVAKNRPTRQINTGWGGRSSRAVDGNTYSHYGGRSCTHTHRSRDGSGYAWWRVELKEETNVQAVEVWNRAGCCGYRLKKFSIQVGNVDRANVNQRCMDGSRSLSVGQGSSAMFTCGLRGKYVFVQLERRDYLTLCEVKVWAETKLNEAIFTKPLALEACSAGKLSMTYDNAGMTSFSDRDCNENSDDIKSISQYETPISPSDVVQSLLIGPGKQTQILSRARGMETVTEYLMDDLGAWETSGDVEAKQGKIFGYGSSSQITTKKTFKAPLMVDFVVKQVGKVDMTGIAQPKSMVMFVDPLKSNDGFSRGAGALAEDKTTPFICAKGAACNTLKDRKIDVFTLGDDTSLTMDDSGAVSWGCSNTGTSDCGIRTDNADRGVVDASESFTVLAWIHKSRDISRGEWWHIFTDG